MFRAASGLPAIVVDTRDWKEIVGTGEEVCSCLAVVGILHNWKSDTGQKQIDKSACPKAVLTPTDWLLFRPASSFLSYPAFDPPCASSHISTFLTHIYHQIIQNDYYCYALWSRVDASQAPVASPKSSFTSS